MTGLEQMAVWLFGTLCASVTVCTAVTAWATARVDVAKEHARAHVDGLQVVAEAQHGPLTVPSAWTAKDGEA